MRRVLLILILLVSLMSAACSYLTDFVVINSSGSPVEVSYKVKAPPSGPQKIQTIPAIQMASELSGNGKKQWHDLAADRYKIDQISRTITVNLLPQEALFITTMHHYTGPDDSSDVSFFPIEEISIVGSEGNLTSSGKQLLNAFSKQSRVLYTLTYQ